MSTIQHYFRQCLLADVVMIDMRSLFVVAPSSMFVMKAIMWGQIENVVAWCLVGTFATLWMASRLRSING